MIRARKTSALRTRSTASVLVLAAMLVGFVSTSCGDDDDGGSSGSSDGGGSEVDVKLDEFSIALEGKPSTGEVTFKIENTGKETHEFVVFRTDLSLTALPTADDGSVDEEGDGIELVDEAEDIAAGDSADLKVNLDAGSYVVVCNVVEKDDGKTESHYQKGMRAAVTVK